MEKLELESLFDSTAINFKFGLDDKFKPFFEIIFDKIKNISDDVIINKFQQLWLKTNKEWNDEFGWGGYPSLARWLEILDKKPLTEVEIKKKKEDYEKFLFHQVQIISHWAADSNLEILFPNKYLNPENENLKIIIDTYCKVKSDLPRKRIIKMGEYLRKKIIENREKFTNEIISISREQIPLLLR